MNTVEPVEIQCPYCWEGIEVLVDCSVAQQEYTEDCSVCCRPIVLTVSALEEEAPQVAVRPEDE